MQTRGACQHIHILQRRPSFGFSRFGAVVPRNHLRHILAHGSSHPPLLASRLHAKCGLVKTTTNIIPLSQLIIWSIIPRACKIQGRKRVYLTVCHHGDRQYSICSLRLIRRLCTLIDDYYPVSLPLTAIGHYCNIPNIHFLLTYLYRTASEKRK